MKNSYRFRSILIVVGILLYDIMQMEPSTALPWKSRSMFMAYRKN